MDTIAAGPWCISAGQTIDLQMQVSTALGASTLTLFANGMPVAQSSQHGSEAGSMSLLYKSEMAEDTQIAVKVNTTADENKIDPLNMQLSYKLYSYGMNVTDQLPAC